MAYMTIVYRGVKNYIKEKKGGSKFSLSYSKLNGAFYERKIIYIKIF